MNRTYKPSTFSPLMLRALDSATYICPSSNMIMVVEKSTLLLCYAVSSGAFDLGFDVDCAHVAHAGIRAVHSYIRRMTIKSVILCTEKRDWAGWHASIVRAASYGGSHIQVSDPTSHP